MSGRWFMRTVRGDFKGISERFGISQITARILVNRGLESLEKMQDYIDSENRELANPVEMYDLEKACEIIDKKIKEKKKIRIIGDYDVDGVCSSYILYDFFKSIGADVSYVIPHRVHDGYGINIDIIDEAKKDGIDTVITCDNGIAAFEQIGYAKKAGLTVVVTDHHDIATDGRIPPADAVVNPKREVCGYPFKKLCGAGVAYQLVRHFNKEYAGLKADVEGRYLAFAALATVCDVMELVGENRIIVKKGLKAIRNTENPGLRSLLNISELAKNDEISVYHCGFVLGPMINASGRLESAVKAMELFLEEDVEKTTVKAEELKRLNEDRKAITEAAVNAAVKIAESAEYREDKVLVILLPDCHESIAGIVAGKVKERFYKPTLIFTHAERGIKGSGRSIEDYDMFKEISKHSECFSKFGGHPMAAGFSLAGEGLEEQKHTFDSLRKKLNETVTLTEDELKPKIYFDMELPPSYITEELVDEFALCEPYGTGNKPPAFARKDMYVQEFRVMGKNGNAARLMLTDGKEGRLYEAVRFGNAAEFEAYINEKAEKKLDIIYSASINEYKGKRSVRIKIEEYK